MRRLLRDRKSAIWLFLAIFALGLVPLAFVVNAYWLSVLIWCNLFAIAAGSWDLLSGYAGQLTFGHSAFFGIGAYAAGLTWKYFGIHPPAGFARVCCMQPQWLADPFVSLLIGVLAALAVSLFLGVCATRVRGPQLAILTFMAALIMQQMVYTFADITDGAFGITPGTLFSKIAGYDAIIWAYWGSILLLVVAMAFMLGIVRSRYGVFFKCIRDDEIAAQAIGIWPMKYKVAAFTISSCVCSLTGAYAFFAFGAVNPTFFSYNFNFFWIEMAVIGGGASIIGSIFGSYFINILIEVLRLSAAFSLLLFGILFVIVLRFFPRGFMALLGYLRKK